MDNFEIKDSERTGSGDSRIRWKSRIFVGIVGAVAIIGFTSVLVYSFLHHYELQSNLEHLDVAESDYLTDIQCEEEFCSTKGCITTAARMVDIVNFETSPCEDFYEYACGNYKRGRAPRFQEDSYNPVKEAEDNVIVALKRILDTEASDDDSDSLKKTRILFSSCTNYDRRDNASLDDFSQFLNDIHLDWPVLNDEWQDDGTDWKLIVRKLEYDYRIHTLFRRHNDISEDNPFGYEILECKIPTLPVETYLYNNETNKPFIMKMYTELLDFAIKSLPVSWETREEFVKEIITLETELARSITESSEESGVQPSRALVEIFEENADRVNELMGHVNPKCGGNVNKILDLLQSRPNKIIKNYLGWRTFYSVMRFLTSDVKQLNDAYIASFPGSLPVYSTRYRECGAGVREEMGLMAAKTCLDYGYFTQQEEDEVRGMMTEMKLAFGALLSTLPWMDNTTLSAFQNKLKSMKLNLGYPENLRNGHPVDHLFHDLEINENDTYFLNIMKVRKHIASLLDNGYRDHSVDIGPLSTRSSYGYVSNNVDVQFGLLRPPVMIYGEDYPKYLKYGHAVHLAHEISHAFDTLGSLFNAHGEREGIDWWPEAVKDKFGRFVGCLRQQEARRSGIDLTNTDVIKLNNDIADLGAFFITYAGLSIHLRIHGEEEKPLPGLNLNKKQTYLVQAAQMYCDLREPRPTIDPYIKTSLTGKERVNSAVRNFEDFGAIFNCPVGSPMNPADKCNLLR